VHGTQSVIEVPLGQHVGSCQGLLILQVGFAWRCRLQHSYKLHLRSTSQDEAP
jgi:hypothetical protein